MSKSTRRLVAAGEAGQLVDVREDNEWEAAHVAGAMHLSKGIIERDIETTFPDKDTKLVLYCGGGYRSALGDRQPPEDGLPQHPVSRRRLARARSFGFAARTTERVSENSVGLLPGSAHLVILRVPAQRVCAVSGSSVRCHIPFARTFYALFDGKNIADNGSSFACKRARYRS